jgi:hypothetical protein
MLETHRAAIKPRGRGKRGLLLKIGRIQPALTCGSGGVALDGEVGKSDDKAAQAIAATFSE